MGPSFDPSGRSQNAVQAATRPHMDELQRLMPAMKAKNMHRTAELYTAKPQVTECQEYARLMKGTRAKGIDAWVGRGPLCWRQLSQPTPFPFKKIVGDNSGLEAGQSYRDSVVP